MDPVVAVPARVESPEAAGDRHVDVDLPHGVARVFGAETADRPPRGGAQRHEVAAASDEGLHRWGLLVGLRRRLGARRGRSANACRRTDDVRPDRLRLFAQS